MGSSRNLLIIGAVVFLLAVGFFVLGKKPAEVAPVVNPSPTSQESSPSSSPTQEASSSSMVKIGADGFTPDSVTIKMGDSVAWTNTDSVVHTVSSNPHPTHTDYAPLNLGPLKAGEEKSLTFPTAGTFKYHDHLHPQFKGTVIVQ